jgi:lysophospholipase L1-like esterase
MGTRARRAFRRPSTVLLSGLLLVASLLLVALLEGGARAFHRLRSGDWAPTRVSAMHDQIAIARQVYRPHAFLNVALREDARIHVYGREIAVNSLGYRSPERPLRKPAGVLRVLCAGGSTTFDIRAQSNDLTWPSLLERELRRRGQPAEVWNAGVPGWTSLENVISLASRDLDLEPDLIVLLQGVNDLQPAAWLPFDRQYEQGHAALVRRHLGLDLGPISLADRSVLLETLNDLLHGPRDPLHVLARVKRVELGTSSRTTVPPEALATFERNIRSLLALARDHHIAVVLVPQLTRIRADVADSDYALIGIWIPGLLPAAVPAQLQKMNDVLRRLAAGAGPRLVDLTRSPDWQDVDFGDPWHFSAQGSEHFARLLADPVAQELARAKHAAETAR